ncbi:ABC transporter permease [Aliidiomarina sedimenti]|uniref:ABC transporter permease n=1 Tax=Aliidiomarina sedimenti TaxID=1933879 RepID=A0ABY0C1V6_9GAMM|nr:ABC transporter permease [Aliidiomarina sedimenti]RUO31836.1 ABC transporter permease [Aliidiomarina sedimenti]
MSHRPHIEHSEQSDNQDSAEQQLRLCGDWTLQQYEQAKAALNALSDTQITAVRTLDGRDISRLDSAGVFLLQQYFGTELIETAQLAGQQQKLATLVLQACKDEQAPQHRGDNPLLQWLEQIGRVTCSVLQQQKQLLAFLGLALDNLSRTLFRPSRWRYTATAAQVEQIGVNAIPIVALLTFLVGAVIAFLGARVLDEFGAAVYTVNLVGFAFLREFAVLLAAILLAGRTASAFTAQLGSMKANEEIDALRAQGLNPVEVLVLPRVLAMLISLPVLTLIAMLCGVLGGMLVCWLALDISPALFMHIFSRDIEPVHFWVGLGKAPVFAFVIALIGCLEGFKVAGSAQSVGEHTTSSVVQSIFMVILLDALFALFFLEMGW